MNSSLPIYSRYGVPFRFAAACSLLLAVQSLVAAPVLSVTADKSDALYGQGEPLVFTVDVEGARPADDGKKTHVQWFYVRDGVEQLATGYAEVKGGKASVALRAPQQPSFVTLRALYREDGKRYGAIAGAGVDVASITPALDAPADFMQFWQSKKDELAAVAIDYSLTAVSTPAPYSAEVDAFELSGQSTGGVPVSGYLARPKNSAAKSLPAILTLHGSGVRSANLKETATWASEGFLALDINAHGLPNGKAASYYKQLENGEYKEYWLRGRTAREEVYFIGMYQRVLRAIDILAAQPQWDGRTLIVYGTSQGGAQAIAAAALDERVTFMVAGLPAYSDTAAALAGRTPGWRKFIPADSDGKPDPVALEISRYFDSANFMRQVKVPFFMTSGFVDSICFPATVHAAYNVAQAPKEMFNDLPSGHRNSPEAVRRMRAAVKEHAGRQGGAEHQAAR